MIYPRGLKITVAHKCKTNVSFQNKVYLFETPCSFFKTNYTLFKRNVSFQNKCFISKQMFHFKTNVSFQNKCFISKQMFHFKTNVSFQNKCFFSKQMFLFKTNVSFRHFLSLVLYDVPTSQSFILRLIRRAANHLRFPRGKKMANVKKFCSSCGQKYESRSTVKFCLQCGFRFTLGDFSTLPAPPTATSTPTMTLESFKLRKESARSSLFRTSGHKKAKRQESVTIRIGLFRYEPDKNMLKPQYGKNQNLNVEKSSTYAEILEKALAKRRAHDRHFNAESQDQEYQLLYPDGSQAVFLPGKPGKFFSLQEYKDDLSSPFNAIKLYLCSVSDVNSFETCETEIVSTSPSSTPPSKDEDNIVNNFQEDFFENPTQHSPPQTVTKLPTPRDNTGKTSSTSSKDLPSSSIPSPSAEYNSYLDVIDDEYYYDKSDFSLTFDDKADLDAAIAASLDDQDNSSVNTPSVQDTIQKFIAENAKTDSDPACILIRRKDIMQTTIKAIERKKFSFFKPLVVSFSGEDGVDSGGPKREYLRLLMQELRSLGVFDGKWFSHGLKLLSDMKYELGGKLVAWSILHGGPGPQLLSQQAFSVFKGLPFSSEEAIEAVGDEDLRSTIHELDACKSPEEFEEFKARKVERVADYGYSRIYSSVYNEKDMIVSCLLKQAFVFSVNAEIHQFLDGLNCVGNLGQLMLSSPHVFFSIMCEQTDKLTASEFIKLYTIEFSTAGSNKRELEEQTMYSFELFLRDVEDKEIEGVTLDNLLVFVTGADAVPPLGFDDKISVRFYDQEPNTRRLPWASTCALELYLPRGPKESDSFNGILLQALQECQGFGKC